MRLLRCYAPRNDIRADLKADLNGGFHFIPPTLPMWLFEACNAVSRVSAKSAKPLSVDPGYSQADAVYDTFP